MKQQKFSRPWRRALAWLVFLGPVFYLTYGFANHITASRPYVPVLVFAWERDIPFWAWTIFPYWSINVFYALSFFLIQSRHVLDRHGLRLITAQLIAVSCFIIFPLKFSLGQPEAEGLAGGLFAALRSFDKPFNQAPSLHIALAVILWDFYRRLIYQNWLRTVLHLWTLLICISVLTTYQHHFIDIPTGALLGMFCLWVWPLEKRVSLWNAWHWTIDKQRLRLAVYYFAGALAVFIFALWLKGIFLWLCWISTALFMVGLNYAALGETGFRKGNDGKISWAAQWMLAPYRLGAWVNSRCWTRRSPHDSEIIPGVWLGRMPSANDHSKAWISIVDVSAELVCPGNIPTRSAAMIDLIAPRPLLLRRAAKYVEQQRLQHGSVLVSCALGYSRSASAMATWLVMHEHDPDVASAISRIQRARPQIVLSHAHVNAIRQALQPSNGYAD